MDVPLHHTHTNMSHFIFSERGRRDEVRRTQPAPEHRHSQLIAVEINLNIKASDLYGISKFSPMTKPVISKGSNKKQKAITYFLKNA